VRHGGIPRLDGRLAALSAGQLISWGILYYALIVASPVVAADTGWSIPEVTLTFSIGLVGSALAGIPVGRWLDQVGPRTIMTLGAMVGPAGLLVVSAAPSLSIFATGWLIVGLAQSAVLYQAAFTVIARRYGAKSRGPMTIVTLAGGLASTVFAPMVAGLLGVMGWREMFLLLAGLLLVTTAPLHWFTLEASWSPRTHADVPRHTLGAVVRTPRFWMLEVSTLALVAALYAVTLAVIPLFTEKGLSYELAAWSLGLLGAGQIIGRLVFVAVPRAAEPWVPLAATAGLSALFLALLSLVPGPPWALVALAVAAGAVRGAQTLVQAAAVVDRWGARNYGTINGVFAAPVTVLIATAPAIGPVVAQSVGSYATMALIAAAAAMVATFAARFS
jgi:MFS family permease